MKQINYDDYITTNEAHFDYVNSKAQVVIVGITPGNSQTRDKNKEQTQDNQDELDLREIKRKNAFAGNMKSNLIAMLDHIGINGLLGIESCKSLWEEDFDKVEMTSLLKDAVFYKGKMLKDVDLIRKSPKLQDLFNNGFVRDCALYTNAKLFVALGPGVYEKLNSLKEIGVIGAEIAPILHPSGQNFTFRSGVFFHKEEINGRDKSYIKAYEFSDISKEIVRKLIDEVR